MKVIKLEVDDSIVGKFMGFLELLPKNKIKIREMPEYSHIPYVSDEEQKDIEKILENKDCHVVSHTKKLRM